MSWYEIPHQDIALFIYCQQIKRHGKIQAFFRERTIPPKDTAKRMNKAKEEALEAFKNSFFGYHTQNYTFIDKFTHP